MNPDPECGVKQTRTAGQIVPSTMNSPSCGGEEKPEEMMQGLARDVLPIRSCFQQAAYPILMTQILALKQYVQKTASVVEKQSSCEIEAHALFCPSSWAIGLCEDLIKQNNGESRYSTRSMVLKKSATATDRIRTCAISNSV
ncbi:hypothetical protein J6590_080719 [Homalodisca vitripennis]|nr:hypothetical protein J6590_080719 [Homalodisca vitripennis]